MNERTLITGPHKANGARTRARGENRYRVPSQPKPSKSAAPVTSLPSTGSDGGASDDGQGLILLMAATATLMAGAEAILTNCARGRQRRERHLP